MNNSVIALGAALLLALPLVAPEPLRAHEQRAQHGRYHDGRTHAKPRHHHAAPRHPGHPRYQRQLRQPRQPRPAERHHVLILRYYWADGALRGFERRVLRRPHRHLHQVQPRREHGYRRW